MADDIDTANARSELEREQVIASRVRYVGTSAFFCGSCGDPIPFARRKAIPGTEHCTPCADALERAAAVYGR